MKKQFTLLSIIVLVLAVVTITAIAQKDKENKGKGNKEQGQNNKDKGNKGNNKQEGNNDNKNDNRGKGNDKNDVKGKGNDNKNDNDNDGDDNNGKGDAKNKMKDGFKWDRETFRDRNDIRKNMDKVTICHKPGKDGDPGVTIRVSSNALKAHLGHGDVEGECPKVSNVRFSDVFLDRRENYYTILQNGQEQVLYSRSILDYALERLTGARSQLVVLQNNNAPAADIERKRLLIVDLEQNVSLLETLIGVTANLVANKLMD